MATQTAWLSCTIGPGQFSDEYAVSAVNYRGHGFSLFAPPDAVDFPEQPGGQPVPGRIRVEILDSKDSLRLVKLPARTMENGDVVTVSVEQLSTAPSRAAASR